MVIPQQIQMRPVEAEETKSEVRIETATDSTTPSDQLRNDLKDSTAEYVKQLVDTIRSVKDSKRSF